MHELSFRTIRIRRGPLGWLKRLRPFYETQVTDGKRVAYGRGPTAEASVQSAQRNWDAQFEITPAASPLDQGPIATGDHPLTA
jgi:hypothetical protein